MALITFILLGSSKSDRAGAVAGLDLHHARDDDRRQCASYFINDAIAKARYKNADSMNFEAPLTSLVWITSIVSVVITFVVSWLTIPTLSGNSTLWWKLAIIISCGTIAGA